MKHIRFLLLAGMVAAALAAAGCHQTEAARAAATGNAGTAAPAASLFSVPTDQMSHVQVVKAARTNWTRVLRLTGNVDYNQFATTPVLSQVSGPVARILVVPGEQVAQGQPLLEIASPDFAQVRNNYLKASDALALAKKVYLRDQDLYAHHAIAQADLEQAESTQAQAQADVEAAEQSLRILGLPNPTASTAVTPMAEIPLKAPIAGAVVERDVSPGQLLQGGATQCFVISDMRTVWVLANVYQSDLAYVHVGDPVTISTDAYPETFRGKIQFVSPALDPNSRTLQARIETANPRYELKKQMYVTATVDAGTLRNIVVVPDAAVLHDDQNMPFVYVQSGAQNQFAQRLVTLGQSQNGFTQITQGLAADEAVVANGSLFVQFANSFQK
ncbi:MAG TPA: efflux RND transporter periplasmic adaptor subunit [Terriglobales bacterium]|nr:efflux RND transporter periplasmic adaptor subunit [Terriglobales bacterium]